MVCGEEEEWCVERKRGVMCEESTRIMVSVKMYLVPKEAAP